MESIRLLDVLLIIVGFLVLIKGADFLVSGASSLAKKLRISDLAIGLTIVAMGTSAPELLVNIISGLQATKAAPEEVQNATGLVFGNIIGSNIFNIFLILGFASVIYPLSVKRSILTKDVPYCIGGMLLLLVLANDTWFGGEKNELSQVDGIILLTGFSIFIFHTFFNVRRGVDVNEDEDDDDVEILSTYKSILFVVLGIAGLGLGGNLVVDSSVSIAEAMNIPKRVIGLTILAGGTSLPELAASSVAAFNKKSDLAIGNIIGSNIFNTMMVLAVTGIATGPLAYEALKLNLDMYITLGGMLLLVGFMYTLDRGKIDRVEGMVLLTGFLGYICLIYVSL